MNSAKGLKVLLNLKYLATEFSHRSYNKLFDKVSSDFIRANVDRI